MNRLAGRVAIVTGAARGMGEAEARLLAAEGAAVVLGDVRVEQAEAVAADIGEAAVAVHLDVTDPDHWAAAVELAAGRGGVDVLVNNAGIHGTSPLESESVDTLRAMFDVNVVGAFLGMQAVLAPMRAAGRGSIVNVSSTAGLAGLPYHAAYGASKWALRGLSRTAAVEWGPHGIRVNTVHPGPIETDMLPPPRGAEMGENRFARLPLGRAGRPEEVARLVLHLASDESSYQTGGEFVVDGGSVA